MDLLNRRVRFRIADVHFPEATRVWEELYGEVFLEGRVMGLSDSGTEKNVFVLVAVDEVKEIVVVPIKRIVNAV